MTVDEKARAMLAIYGLICPECGAPATWTAISEFDDGTPRVEPLHQCNTDGCTYNEDGNLAWELESSS